MEDAGRPPLGRAPFRDCASVDANLATHHDAATGVLTANPQRGEANQALCQARQRDSPVKRTAVSVASRVSPKRPGTKPRRHGQLTASRIRTQLRPRGLNDSVGTSNNLPNSSLSLALVQAHERTYALGTQEQVLLLPSHRRGGSSATCESRR